MQKDLFYIDKVLSGDTAAFAELVNRHKDMVFTITNRVLKSREDAEEIAQDVFLKVFQSLEKFKRESKFSTWVYRIAFNTAVSKVRKKKMEVLAIDENLIENYTFDEIIDDTGELSLDDKKKYYEIALKKISEEDNLILTMFYLEEQSIDDISEITGLSVSNVKVKLHRTRKKLYEHINTMIKYRVGELI
jgi:RNA polymerase sigma factor (sigma-70 family)